MKTLRSFALVLLAATAAPMSAEETDYLDLKWGDEMSVEQVMEWVRDAMDRSPVMKKSGQAKGFVFKDNKVKQTKLYFSQSLKLPVPKGYNADQEAQAVFGFFHTLLEIGGLALADRGNVYEIVEGKTRQKKPIRIYSQQEAQILPAEDMLVAQLYTFKNYDPVNLQAVLGQVLNSAEGGEGVWPLTNTRTVVLVALASKMRELHKLLEIVDQGTSAPAIAYVPLTYANASEIEPTVTQILRARQQAGGRPALPGRENQQALVLPNPRTNKEMIVLASPEETREIEALIRKLDTKLEIGKTSVEFFRIKHRNATEVKDVIDRLYSQRQQVTGQPGPAPSRPGMAPPGMPGVPSGAESEEIRSLLIPPQIVADAGALGADGRPVLDSQGRPVSSGGTNTLIVIAPSDRVLAEVKEIIAEVDRRKPVVAIEAIVMELGPDASREVGVELAVGDEPSKRMRGAGATSLGMSTPDFSAAPPGRVPPAGGLTAYLFKNTAARIPFLIKLQEIDSLTDVLARPTLLAGDNETAKFTISRQEPFQKQETTSGGVITTSQAFEKAETVLEFTPNLSVEMIPVRGERGSILKDERGDDILEMRKYVRLQVSQQIESFKGAATFEGGTPPKESRKAETTVPILDGDTVAIGGFTSKNKRKTVTKVPMLGDVPLLGWLFRREQDTDSMTTLFIFITPHIMEDLRDLEKLPDNIRTPEQVEELKERLKDHFPEVPGSKPKK